MGGLGQLRPARPAGLRPVVRRDGLVVLAVPSRGQVERQALRLLNARDVPAAEVVRVDPYAVAFVNREGVLMTAWTTRQALDGGQERLTVVTERGLPAFPSG